MRLEITGRAFFLVVFLLYAGGCRHDRSSATIDMDTLLFTPVDTIDTIRSEGTPTPPDAGSSIRYGIYSPIETSEMFRRKGIHYDPEVLAPLKDLSAFTTRTQVALALGVYGADLSYIQMFGSGDAARYLDIIVQLSGQLGIPAEYVTQLVDRINNNISSNDSLIQISLEAYNHINKFLIRENQEDIAYLILAGAWIEAMYIAVHDLLKNNDPEVVKKVVEQKYSLNYLLSSMKNFYNDTSVAYIYRRLFVLKKYLDRTQLDFKDQEIEIDKDNKEIHAQPASVLYTPETLEKIRMIVIELRNQILKK